MGSNKLYFKDYKNNKPLIIIILVILSVIGILFLVNNNSQFFSFESDEDIPLADGEVFFDNLSIGFTQDGKIKIPKLEETPFEVIFIGTYNGSEFKVVYAFPEDYLDHSTYPFLLNEEYILTGIEERKMELKYLTEVFQDPYSHTNETHWTHMPLTYNYVAGGCKESYNEALESDIKGALDYISKKTNYTVTFKRENSEEVDIDYFCSIPGLGLTLAYASPYVDEETNTYYYGRVDIFSSGPCRNEKPTVMIHETLHLLGLKDISRIDFPRDIMKPYEDGDRCNQDITEEDLNYLKNIYQNTDLNKGFD